MNVIDSFRGEYFFLSNFYDAPVEYNGIKYRNNEAAFQAQKCTSEEYKKSFSNLTASEAKRDGRRCILRKDWEDIKINIMYEIVRAKFTQNRDLTDKLLATGDAYLIEGNNWGDRVWGQVNGVGANNLGIILMRVRDELR